MNKKVIIRGAHVKALGAIRSLGLKGIKSDVLYYNPNDFAYVSRYVNKKYFVADPKKDEQCQAIKKTDKKKKKTEKYEKSILSLMIMFIHKISNNRSYPNYS